TLHNTDRRSAANCVVSFTRLVGHVSKYAPFFARSLPSTSLRLDTQLHEKSISSSFICWHQLRYSFCLRHWQASHKLYFVNVLLFSFQGSCFALLVKATSLI